jgi:YVTN family beta-propeller protein
MPIGYQARPRFIGIVAIAPSVPTPLGIAVSPDGSQAAVATASNFAPRALQFIDLATQTVAQTLSIGNSFVGVAYSPDGNTLYVGGGADNNLKIFTRGASGQWALAPRIPITSSAPSGLSLSPSGDKLYVALNTAHALGIVDTTTRAVVQIPSGAFPYTTATTKDGLKVYVSNWGGRLPQAADATDGSNPVVVDPATGIANNGTISVYDTSAQKIAKTIEVGLHPSAMALSSDGSRLYVANANSDSISVINTTGDIVEKTIDVRMNGSPGSAPNAIVVSDDGRTLYVANAGNNAVVVVDPADRHAIRGFIPVGWFPASLALTKDDRLLVGNGYGFGSIAPTAGGSTGRSYADRKGYVSMLDVPGRRDLARFTEQVRDNNEHLGGDHARGDDDHGGHGDDTGRDGGEDRGRGDDRDRGHGPDPIPSHAGQRSPIEHVIYIIKENRTYDQVFGDLPQGNGDPDLAIFGRAVTPNIHALAERFVLFDNYYTAGDQSALGHQWCDEAYSNDYVHKYGNARNDFAGTNPMAFAPSGFIWDNAIRHGRSARIFGEFTNRTVKTPSNATWLDFYTGLEKRHARAGPRRQHERQEHAADHVADLSGLRHGHPGAGAGRPVPPGIPHVRAEREPAEPDRHAAAHRSHQWHVAWISDTARHGGRQRSGPRADRGCGVAQPLLAEDGGLRDRGRRAEWSRPRGRPSQRGTGHQPVHASRGRGQHFVFNGQHRPHDRADPRAADDESIRRRRYYAAECVHQKAESGAVRGVAERDPTR